MVTLTVDDRQLVVSLMQTILKRLDPQGLHLGSTLPAEALELAEKNPLDVAFLDVEMPGMNGIELAERLQGRFPLLNVIFITGYQEYMPSAFKLYASGYILKPVTEQAVSEALAHLRYRREELRSNRLSACCFGAFEVYCDGKPVAFSRSKSKELLAYLIDRKGATCSFDMILGNLWPDEPVTSSLKSQLRTIMAELRKTLEELGVGDVLVHQERIGLSVDPNRIDCDYYRFLRGDPVAVHQFRGDYMNQYSFAAETRSGLQRRFMEE